MSIELFEGAATSVASNLERLGLKKSGARPLAEEICAAAFTRQVAFFKGAQANAVARSAALSLAGPACVRASMPVGLTSGEAIDAARDLIGSTAASSRALLIEGVNRTALDVYAEAVTDLMEVSVPPSAGRGFEFIFATLSQGVASLAVEPRQLELGPIFDLDHLDWRLCRTVAAPAPGCISVDALLALRSRLEKASVESEELVRLLRRFQPKKNPASREGLSPPTPPCLRSIVAVLRRRFSLLLSGGSFRFGSPWTFPRNRRIPSSTTASATVKRLIRASRASWLGRLSVTESAL